MSNEELSMRRIRPRWLSVLALYFGLLAAGCETVEGGPAAAALLSQKEAPVLPRGPAADLFAELDQAVDATKNAESGNVAYEHVKQASARLAELGPRVIPALLHRMVHAPGEHAEAVVGVFGAMKKRARPAVPTLVALLEDAPPPVRDRAARSLQEIGIPSEPVVDALVEIYEDEDQEQSLRINAGFAIASLTWHGSGQAELEDVDDAIAALRVLLEDGETPGRLRQAAVASLARIRPASDEVLEGLIHALHDQDASVRAAAAKELNRLKGLTQ